MIYYIKIHSCFLFLISKLSNLSNILAVTKFPFISNETIEWSFTTVAFFGILHLGTAIIQSLHTGDKVCVRKFNPPLFAELSLPLMKIRPKHSGVVWEQNEGHLWWHLCRLLVWPYMHLWILIFWIFYFFRVTWLNGVGWVGVLITYLYYHELYWLLIIFLL